MQKVSAEGLYVGKSKVKGLYTGTFGPSTFRPYDSLVKGRA